MGAAVSACRGWLAPRTGRLVALGVPVLLGVLLYGVLVTVLGLPEAKLIGPAAMGRTTTKVVCMLPRMVSRRAARSPSAFSRESSAFRGWP